jgi:phenylalanyl-tRNA synthetase beta chain
MPAVRQAGAVPESFSRRARVREAMVRAGLLEALTYSFASAADLALMGQDESRAIHVANPLTADQEFLRTSLLPGLLRAAVHNVARRIPGVALFEVGRTFGPDDPIEERERVGLIVAGTTSSGFPGESRPMDFFDAKGSVEALLGALGVSSWSLGQAAPSPFNPARSAMVLIGGEIAGVVGELHPRLAEEMDLPARTSLAELDLAVVWAHAASTLVFTDVPRFPPVHRDLAFVVDATAAAGDVLGTLVEAAGELLDAVVLFDVFEGGPIPEGKKSLAFSVDFRAPDRTLTDEEAERVVQAIVERLARDFGADLRSG